MQNNIGKWKLHTLELTQKIHLEIRKKNRPSILLNFIRQKCISNVWNFITFM